MEPYIKEIAIKLNMPLKHLKVFKFKGAWVKANGRGGNGKIWLNSSFFKKRSKNFMKRILIHEYIHNYFYGSGIKGYDISLLPYYINPTKRQLTRYLRETIILEQNTELLALFVLYELDKKGLTGHGYMQYFTETEKELFEWFNTFEVEEKV